MTKADTNAKAGSKASEPEGLARRDYFLLPLTSLAAVLIVIGASELLTRIIWAEQTTNKCMLEGSARFKPNCSVRLKNAEGPWATYHYNDCGYRSVASCGSKPPETVRIVIVGSSMAYGNWVSEDQMYSSIASGELGQLCNRRIEVQNLAGLAMAPSDVYRRIEEALELKPDVVLYLFGSWDVEQQVGLPELVHLSSTPNTPTSEDRWNNVRWINPALRAWIDAAMQYLDFHPNEIAHHPAKHIRTLAVAQHFFFRDRDTYLRTITGDKDDYLRQPFTPAWQRRFAAFSVIVANMARKVNAVGVPLVVMAVPSRKEAALFGLPQLLPHIDPFAFGREIENIATNHGAEYVDLMDAFSRVPDPERLFYVADAHPAAAAQKVIAKALVQKLQDGSIPAFSHCTLQTKAERGNQP